MNRRFIIAVVIFLALVAAIVIVVGTRTETVNDGMKVSASFYPMAEFARQVGGDRVEVVNLTPPGAEPHDFEPTPQDIIEIRESKVFIYSGAGFDPWAEKILPDLGDVAVINASEEIALMPAAAEENGGQAQNTHRDPHFYLDPVLDQQVIETIADRLAEADPDGAEMYRENASAYIEKLADLDKEYREGLMDCSKKDIVTQHDAFAYLANRYDFRQTPIAGLAEEEPSPAALAEVAEFARNNQVEYVFVEKLVSPRLAETIAGEIGVKTLVLDPIEGLTPEEEESGKDFISLMTDNLANLRLALDCR